MSELSELIQREVLTHQLLQRGDAVVVAVSGGLDSMVLLHLLHSLPAEHGWKLHVAHFNHLLRGDESNADEALVQKTAGQLSLPFTSDRADVRKFAAEQKLSVEMAARQLRHQFLARVAQEQRIGKIALAHHADDQVELFFVRLLRGAGLTGLAGMAWSSPSPIDPNLQLIRPLLACRKAALREYAASERIAFREDSTNESLDILRNRIRHELLPLLAERYQRGIANGILRVMDVIRAESELIDSFLRETSESQQTFDALPLALQRRSIEAQLIELRIPPNFTLIEHLRLSDGPIMIHPETVLSRDPAGRLHLEPVPRGCFDSDRLVVSLLAERGAFCFKNVSIEWEIVISAMRAEDAKGTDSPLSPLRGEGGCGAELFDADKIGDSIVLRHWQPGDRFQPIGMAQSVKLQDFFMNEKVPRDIRHKLLVGTTANGEIFWVEGLRISERFKLDQSTKKVLKWAWQRR